MTPTDLTRLDAQLQRLHLPYIQSHYQALATRAAEQQRSHLDYLEQLPLYRGIRRTVHDESDPACRRKSTT
jgi:hypothetical protein